MPPDSDVSDVVIDDQLEDVDGGGLAAARGCVVGALISLALWAALIGAASAVWRWAVNR